MNLVYAYRLLNVNSSSTKKEIRKKYLKMVNIFHPDKLKYSKNHEKLNWDITIEDINEAYNVILTAMDDENKQFENYESINTHLNEIDSDLEHEELIANFNKDILSQQIIINNEPKYEIIINKHEAQKGTTKKIIIQNQKNKMKQQILVKIPPKIISGQSILIKDYQNNEFIVVVDVK